MRRIAIMQPYFFPYIGYFMLIANSDAFIFNDDVQYIKGGWSNRNDILIDQRRTRITLPVAKSSSSATYLEKSYVLAPSQITKLLNMIRQAYRKAAYFEQVFEVIENSVRSAPASVAGFNMHTLRAIFDYLDLDTPTFASSTIARREGLSGEDRVIALCRSLGAEAYLNPPGGQHLYNAKNFAEHDMALQFCHPNLTDYPQPGEGFEKGLSIIDALMHNSPERMRAMLQDCRIETVSS